MKPIGWRREAGAAMSSAIRLLRCLLGIASPSLMVVGMPPATSWLSRWEHKIAAAVARRFAMLSWCDVVHVFDPRSGIVYRSIDVTGRSIRAQRRVLNRWRRRAAPDGMDARLTGVLK